MISAQKPTRYARRARVRSLLDAVSVRFARLGAIGTATNCALDLLSLEDRVLFNAAPLGNMPAEAVDAVSEPMDDVIEMIDSAVRHESSETDKGLVTSEAIAPTTADARPGTDDGQAAGDEHPPASGDLSLAEHARRSYELVVVDQGVENFEAFIRDIQQRGTSATRYEIIVLDQDTSGIATISATLAERTGIDAVHFVSHGAGGAVRFGTDWLDAASFERYAWQFGQWRFALNDEADLLFYGCDLASNAEGRELLDALGTVCDCEVAASDNDTGHASLGGDWALEYATGTIEADIAFSEQLRDNWEHLLDEDEASPLAPTAELLVNFNQTLGTQQTSNENRGSSRAVATAPDGSYVVVWTDDNGGDADVFGQRYNRFGEPQGGNFQVNQVTSNDQRWASVDTDNAGNFVVAWVSEGQDGTARSIYARRYAADGTPQGGELKVNTHPTGIQDNVSVAVDADGDFVVVWEGDGAGGYDVYGRRFDSSGMAAGSEFQVNTLNPGFLGEPVAAMADNGQFVVVWDDADGVQAQLYDATGAAVGGQFEIDNSNSAGESGVAMDADGNFVVVWRDTSGSRVRARIYDASGTPLGSRFEVHNSNSGTQTDPSVDVDASGNFVVVWEGKGPGDGNGVFYRRYTSSGVALDADEVLANQTTSGTQDQASVAVQDVDNFVVVWSGNGPGDGDGVFSRQFGNASRPPLNSPPIARDNDYSISENATRLTANAILDNTGAGVDSDPDGDELLVLAVNGDPNLVQVPIDLASGATLLVKQDGTVSYDLNGQFHALANGQATSDSFRYTIADGWNVRMIRVTGDSLENLTQVENLFAAATGTGPLSVGSNNYVVELFQDDAATEIDYGDVTTLGAGLEDDFDVNQLFPDGTLEGGDQFLVHAASTWEVPAGTYTLALGSDDGGYLRIGNEKFDSVFDSDTPAGTNEIRWESVRSFNRTGGTFTVTQPTAVTIESLYWDRTINAALEISIASGMQASFDAAVSRGGSFQLLQNGTLGWSLTQSEATVGITVQGANDAPALNTATGFTLDAIDDGTLNPPGNTVAEIIASVAGSPITDADTPASQIGIALVGSTSPAGRWQYSINDAASWTDLDSVSSESAVTLNPSAKLRFVPQYGQPGSASIAWRAWDQTAAGNGQAGVDTTPNGGGTAFSSATAVATIFVGNAIQPPNANPESYTFAADVDSVTVAAPGLLANDVSFESPVPPSPIAGALLEYDAANSTGSELWANSTSVSGFDLLLAGAVRVDNPATQRAGIHAAYDFDGSGGGVTASLESLPGTPTTKSATFEFWIRPDHDGDEDVLFETGATIQGVSFSIDDTTLKFKILDAGGDDQSDPVTIELTAPGISTAEFTHVVGTIDLIGNEVKLYMDGILRDSQMNSALDTWAGGNGTGIGKDNSGINFPSGGAYEGEVAIVRFYGQALTASQVQTNYKAVADGMKIIGVSENAGFAGQLDVRADGRFVYRPRGAFDALDAGQQTAISFDYIVQDGEGLSAAATATIVINGVDDAPIARPDSFAINSGDTLTVGNRGVLGNDFDAEGQTLSATVTSAPTKGTLTLRADGSFVYVAKEGAVGPDEFFYVANDGTNDSQPARVRINVLGGGAGNPPPDDGGDPSGSPNESDGADEGSSEAEQDNSSRGNGEATPSFAPPPNSSPPPTAAQPQRDATFAPAEDNAAGTADLGVGDGIAVLQPVANSSASSSSDSRDRLHSLAQESVAGAVNSSPLAAGIAQAAGGGEFAFISPSGALWQDLEELEDLVEHEIRFEAAEVASALGVTSTLSVGYVLWFLRGTYLVSCVLAQMPAWKMVDPLFVFGGGDLLSDDEDESLTAMLQRSNDAEHDTADAEEPAAIEASKGGPFPGN